MLSQDEVYAHLQRFATYVKKLQSGLELTVDEAAAMEHHCDVLSSVPQEQWDVI